ncbi:sporulation histidine kinase inhibitor Sda [Neobacillus niacini]|nr:sporulation histidine kinase inhibitor Sda [Neobacillus niacini]
MFSSMSNKVLIETYNNAVKLKLDVDFLKLLEEEINRRGIQSEKVE